MNIFWYFGHENEIFVTGKNIVGEKTFIEIVKGKYNENEIEFKSIIKLESEGCILRNSVHSGKIQIFENNKNKILISINSAGQLDEPKLDSLNADSICGKILLVNAENNNYEIFSSGHRNIIGLYADGNLVLSTEHGPFAGDEINKIEKEKNMDGLSFHMEKNILEIKKISIQPIKKVTLIMDLKNQFFLLFQL